MKFFFNSFITADGGVSCRPKWGAPGAPNFFNQNTNIYTYMDLNSEIFVIPFRAEGLGLIPAMRD